jgi:hypothetical protein
MQTIRHRRPLGLKLRLRSQIRVVGDIRLCRTVIALKTVTILCFLSQMASDWVTTCCIQEEGFPQVLYAATARLGILDRLEYVGHEYVEDDTEYCEVTMHIGASGRFPEMGPWCVIATGTRVQHLSSCCPQSLEVPLLDV